MRSEYYKGLTKQEAYNITDGLSVTLHEISLKRFGLDWNKISTDFSNEILEICDEVIDQMHEELDERLKRCISEQGGETNEKWTIRARDISKCWKGY